MGQNRSVDLPKIVIHQGFFFFPRDAESQIESCSFLSGEKIAYSEQAAFCGSKKCRNAGMLCLLPGESQISCSFPWFLSKLQRG